MPRPAPNMPTTSTRPHRRLTAALRGALPSALVQELELEPYDVAPTRPDLFWRHRGPGRGGVAVFVDGCAWHGCKLHGRKHMNPDHGLSPERVLSQQQTDRRGRAAMRAKGIAVLEIWEHDVDADLGACVRQVMDALGVPMAPRGVPSSPRARGAPGS